MDDVMTQDVSTDQDNSQSGSALSASQGSTPGALSSSVDTSAPAPAVNSVEDFKGGGTEAASAPAPAPDAQGILPSDNPRLQRVAGSLWNALKGIAAPVINSEKQQLNRLNTLKNNQVQESNAKVQFLNAQAAEQVARASIADKQMQSWDEEHQMAMQQQNLTNMKLAKDAGFVVRAVTSMDQGVEANTKAAMNNFEQLSPVAPMLYFHVGHQVVAMQMQDPNAGVDVVNQTRQAQGLTPYTQAQWQGLPQQVQQSLTMSAVNFNDPGNGTVTEDTLQTLQNRLANVKAQPDFNGKDGIVSRLQTAVKNHTAILDAAKARGNKQKTDEAVAAANTPQGRDEHALKQAQVSNLNSEAEARNRQTALTESTMDIFQKPDATGFTPVAPPGAKAADILKEYNKKVDAFKKNSDDLSKTEGTFNQFQQVLNDINAGKGMTGAQSVVGLFNAIGISATPLKGAGFRINSNTINEHVEARGLGSSLYQKLLSVKNGDIITPGQLKDYATIAMQARHDQYVNLINQAHNQGLNANFLLPRGNNQKVDTNTATIFFQTAQGSTPQEKAANARKAAQAMGWQVQ